jgi:hypothetical protein
MYRTFSLVLLALPLVACAPSLTGGEPGGDPGPDQPTPSEQRAELPVAGVAHAIPGKGHLKGHAHMDQTEPAPTCGASYEPAPAGTPACGAGVACDSDADCAVYPGNYCQPAVCAYLGCLRGACWLTKVMGQACTRDGECVSQKCDCTDPAACVCAPEEGPPDFSFP